MITIFLLAGFDLHVTAKDPAFAPLRRGLEQKGYRVVPVDISWRHKTPTQYAKEFTSFYKKQISERNVIVGNSFGAVVAFISASELKPEALYLCSLSPFFKEDRGKRPDSYGVKVFGIRRMRDLWSISAKDTGEKINKLAIKTTVVYGEREHKSSPVLVARCIESASQIKGAKLVEIPKAPHDMADEVYSHAVIDLVVG